MKIELWAIGKLKNRYLEESLQKYLKRIQKYQSFQIEEITIRAKSTDSDYLKKTEAEKVLSRLTNEDYLILMDENGQHLSSVQFSSLLQKSMMRPASRIIFLIGGAFGFDQTIYDRAQDRLSLSEMTFPHDLARLMTAEQLYRAFSILNHSPYHH